MRILIVGAGGHGQVVADILEAHERSIRVRSQHDVIEFLFGLQPADRADGVRHLLSGR